MTAATAAPAFRKGGRAAAERAVADKEERDRKRSGAFNTWEYLRLAAAEKGEVYGESKILRLVTDEPEWIEVLQHSFVNTKPAPDDMPAGRKWPKAMGAVCRYTQVPQEDGSYARWFEDCAIDDLELAKGEGKNGPYVKKAGVRLWAIAVEREAYTTEDGETSYRDVMHEVTDKDGKTQEIPKFLVLNFGMDNFFDYLLGYANVYKGPNGEGTVVDRDYKVTRVGSGTDTDYNIVALDPVTVVKNGKIVKLIPDYEVPFRLEDIVAEQASKQHYDWFFDTRVKTSWTERFGAPKEGNDGGAESSKKSEDPAGQAKNREQLDAMRQRLLESKQKATANA